MILIIMRHGEAVQYQEPDHNRALTDFGKTQCEQVGFWLHRYMLSINETQSEDNNHLDVALVSPYLRTQQSFRALSKGIRVAQQITIDSVTPNGSASQAADLIHGYATDVRAPKSLIVITHMPLVSLLADKVCHGFDAKYFDTADALIIDYDERTGMGSQLAFYQGTDEQEEAT